MSTVGTASFDQAAGLRELFGSQGLALENVSTAVPPVHALICPVRPALTLPLGELCSGLLLGRGWRHAWVDEIDFGDREQWPLPCPVRFDLGQTLANHVPLASALLPMESPMRWYASARRLSQAAGLGGDSLSQRLALSGLVFDSVLLCAHSKRRLSWALYARQVQPVILCPVQPDALAATLDWVGEQPSGSGLALREAGVVLLGDTATASREAIQQHWQSQFGQLPAWIDTAPWQPDDQVSALSARWKGVARSLIEHLVNV